MRKTWFWMAVVGLLVCAGSARADIWGREISISAGGTPTTVSISTSAWTKVPAASSLARRAGVVVSVPASNTANVVGHLGGCSSTSIAITVRPMEFVKGGGFTLVPIDENVCLYLLSIHTGAENVHVQEIRQ